MSDLSDDEQSVLIEHRFALSPVLANDGIIDYRTPTGAKLYQTAISKLSDKPFDCESSGLRTFLTMLKERTALSGWNDIMLIPKDLEEPHHNFTHLLTNYGEVDIEQVQAHSITYVNGANRSAQDSSQLYHCLMNSMSSEGTSKISVWSHEYIINDVGRGPVLLKVIIRESDMDTNSMECHIRQKLSSLDLYILTIDHDILKFNIYVQTLVRDLWTNGHTTQDLLSHLFKVYQTVPNKTFSRYITSKEDAYYDGFTISPDALMKQCANKYKLLIQQKNWNAPSSEKKEIIALKA